MIDVGRLGARTRSGFAQEIKSFSETIVDGAGVLTAQHRKGLEGPSVEDQEIAWNCSVGKN